jgi:hypothetical protein
VHRGILISLAELPCEPYVASRVEQSLSNCRFPTRLHLNIMMLLSKNQEPHSSVAKSD